jgi:uncharacterized protein (DUF433 family)
MRTSPHEPPVAMGGAAPVAGTVKGQGKGLGTGSGAMCDEQKSAVADITQVPGILFTPIERRARIQGTGIEVFEVIKSYRSVGENWEDLREAYHWLTEDQLRAALTFYAKNRAFVEASLEPDEIGAIEAFWEKYPQTRPPQR